MLRGVSIRAGLALLIALAFAGPTVAVETPGPSAIAAEKSKAVKKSTADHTKFKALEGPFTSGPEVTKACLSCHTEASHQVMQSIHWKWDTISPTTGKRLGKARTMNSFCGSPLSNEPRCTSCHAGYGWTDARQPPPNEPSNVDCLACHDKTGTYKKVPTDAGHPAYVERKVGDKIVPPPDLAKIARSVGAPGRENCGACHFNGGGGDAVKHGDLDTSLIKPSKELDVHMSPDGQNMTCATCHTFNPRIQSGSRYAKRSIDTHGQDPPQDAPHGAPGESGHGAGRPKVSKLTDHPDGVACQPCHIPEFARGGVATKMLWDWSTAGKKDADGKPIFIKDDHGHLKYSAEKGDFAYGENVRPTYKWYNGVIEQVNIGDKFDDKSLLHLNKLNGGAADPKARIWPFKEMKGKQPYDPELKTLVVNHVFGKDDSAFWGNFDIQKSVKFGMEYAGLPWSGKVDFIETRMYWPITHMVAPKGKALNCAECHSHDGRLGDITGVYLPGRDTFRWLDLLGYAAFGLTILGILGHSAARILMRKKTTGAH